MAQVVWRAAARSDSDESGPGSDGDAAKRGQGDGGGGGDWAWPAGSALPWYGSDGGSGGSGGGGSDEDQLAGGGGLSFEEQLAALNLAVELSVQDELDALEQALYHGPGGGRPAGDSSLAPTHRDGVHYALTTPANAEEWAEAYAYLRVEGVGLGLGAGAGAGASTGAGTGARGGGNTDAGAGAGKGTDPQAEEARAVAASDDDVGEVLAQDGSLDAAEAVAACRALLKEQVIAALVAEVARLRAESPVAAS
jgi:hypothetical protein